MALSQIRVMTDDGRELESDCDDIDAEKKIEVETDKMSARSGEVL
jgi:hypothetical protein